MTENSHPSAKRLEIKKYSNRRYYDATHSRHLTLEEIHSLIQQGYDIQVTDGATSADITAQVLMQIILELDTPKLDSLPVPLLVRMIRMNDSLVRDFIEKYFNQALKSFFDYQRQAEEQIRKTHGLPVDFAQVSAWSKAMLNPFTSVFTPVSQEPPTANSPAETPDNRELRELIESLQQQIEQLKLKSNKRKVRAGAKKTPKRR